MRPGLWLKTVSLLLAALLLLGGCAQQAPVSSQEEVAPLANDGRSAQVVVGEILESRERTDVLLEIAEKYMADYPNTQVTVMTYATPESLQTALAAGQVQIADLPREQAVSCIQAGLLSDLGEDFARWTESATLQTPMKWASHGGDSLHTYLFPSDLSLPVLLYRQDRMDAYNEGKASAEMIYCRSWDQLLAASEALGDQGKLVFAGDRLVDRFDTFVWSKLTVGRLLDTGFGYYYPVPEGEPQQTVFTQETAAQGAEQFLRLMTRAALPETFSYTEDQALQAFLDGRASFLLAGREAVAAVQEALPEGAWAVRGYPVGMVGVSVVSPYDYRGWGVAADAADRDIVLHFLATLSNADNNTHYAVTCGTFPLHSTSLQLEPDLTSGVFSGEISMARSPEVYFCAQEPLQYRAWADYRPQANEKLRQYLAGDLTQKDLLAWLDSYWMAAFEAEGPRWSTKPAA